MRQVKITRWREIFSGMSREVAKWECANWVVGLLHFSTLCGLGDPQGFWKRPGGGGEPLDPSAFSRDVTHLFSIFTPELLARVERKRNIINKQVGCLLMRSRRRFLDLRVLGECRGLDSRRMQRQVRPVTQSSF